MSSRDRLGYLFERDATNAAGRSGETLGHNVFADTNGLENLGTDITLDGGDPHLGHDLEEALIARLYIVRMRLFCGQVCGHAVQTSGQEFVDRFKRQVGVHGIGAVAKQHRHVMYFARFGRLDNKTDPAT